MGYRSLLCILETDGQTNEHTKIENPCVGRPLLCPAIILHIHNCTLKKKCFNLVQPNSQTGLQYDYI